MFRITRSCLHPVGPDCKHTARPTRVYLTHSAAQTGEASPQDKQFLISSLYIKIRVKQHFNWSLIYEAAGYRELKLFFVKSEKKKSLVINNNNYFQWTVDTIIFCLSLLKTRILLTVARRMQLSLSRKFRLRKKHVIKYIWMIYIKSKYIILIM